MVQIPQYTQQVGLAAPSRDIPNVIQPSDGGIGQALQSLGGQISQMAAAAQARQNRMDEFNTRVRWDQFQEQQAQTLTEMERNAQGDGAGLHDGFMKWRQENGPKFLSTITNPELRARYETLFSTSDAEHYSNLAANTEFKIANTYTVNELTTASEKAKLGIAQNPGSYKNYLTDMEERINTAPNLTVEQRQKMITDLHEQGPKFLAAGLEQSDPETFHFLMGLGSNQDRLAFLTRRVIAAESGGDPGVVSPTGAVGLMQVQPETAVDIAKKFGDKQFLALSPAQRVEFLKNPSNSIRYGQAYLGMMVERYNGDVEAALVAYNAGPGNADKWLAAGRDYKALPKPQETQPYVSKVLDGMGGAQYVSGAVVDASGAPATTGKRIPIQTGTQAGRQPLQMAGVSNQVIGTWEAVQGDFGRALPVVSGFRDAATNRKAGGANKSQHIDGNALDIDISGLSKEDRIRLIQIASAHGFTGIGIYRNSIHVDMRQGAPVAWGSTHHAASVPAWAFHVAAQHRAGAYRKGGMQVADASGTGGLPASDAGPQYADGVPGTPAGVSRSGFVSPLFEGMSAGDYLKMQHDAATGYTKAAQTQLAQSTADQILATAGATTDQPADRKAAYTALDAIGDAELRKDVRPLLDNHFTRWDAVQKDQQETAVKDTWTQVETALGQNDTNAAFAIAKRANIPQADRDKIMERISKGAVQYDDPKVLQAVDAMRFSNPTGFADVNIRGSYGNQLTNQTITAIEQQQAAIKKSAESTADANANQMKTTVSAANSIVNDNLKAIGIPTDAKNATPEDIQHANLIRAMVGRELEIRQQASKTPLLTSEITDTVNSVMKTYPRFKPIESSWIPWQKADADVSLPEVLQSFDAAGQDINLAADALRRAGKPVNAATLQQTLDDYLAVKNGGQ